MDTAPAVETEGRSATLLPTLPTRFLQQLLVLLLPHALTALLDQGSHGGRDLSGQMASGHIGGPPMFEPGRDGLRSKVASGPSGVV
jgi:hypothetical protein